MEQSLRNMASTLPKTNTIKNGRVNQKDGPTFSLIDKEVEIFYLKV